MPTCALYATFAIYAKNENQGQDVQEKSSFNEASNQGDFIAADWYARNTCKVYTSQYLLTNPIHKLEIFKI